MSERELLLIECDEAMRQMVTTIKLVTSLAHVHGIKMVTLFVKVADDQSGVADDDVALQEGVVCTNGMCTCDECRKIFQKMFDSAFVDEEAR